MTLLNLWGSLEEACKTSVAKTFPTLFNQLRKLQHPESFENINGGPPLDDVFLVTHGASQIKTSFAIKDELIDWIIQIYSLEAGERMAHEVRYYQHILLIFLLPFSPRVSFKGKTSSCSLMGRQLLSNGILHRGIQPTGSTPALRLPTVVGMMIGWHDYVRMALDEYPNQSPPLWLSSMKIGIWA